VKNINACANPFVQLCIPEYCFRALPAKTISGFRTNSHCDERSSIGEQASCATDAGIGAK